MEEETPQTAQARKERLRVFGERLAKLRAERELTQAELGNLVGGTQSRVSRWELGEVLPPRETVLELEARLELPSGALAGLLGYTLASGEAPAAGLLSTEEVIMADPGLDENGKAAVLAVYRAFLKRKRKRVRG